MKRIWTWLLIFVCLLTFSSCGGRSVSIYLVLRNNEIEAQFLYRQNLESLTETVEYMAHGERPAFSYEIYYERAEDIYSKYNICETVGNTALLGYEGSVWTQNGDGLCAIALLGGTYLQFLDGYLTGAFPFSCEKLNQISSAANGETTVVRYYSEVTPQQAAALREFGVTVSDRILTEFEIDGASWIRSISYAVENGKTGETTEMARRTFSASETKREGVFDAIPADAETIAVEVTYLGEDKQGKLCRVAVGVPVGFDTGEELYDFFYDEAATLPYSYADGAPSGDLRLYAKKR